MSIKTLQGTVTNLRKTREYRGKGSNAYVASFKINGIPCRVDADEMHEFEEGDQFLLVSRKDSRPLYASAYII